MSGNDDIVIWVTETVKHGILPLHYLDRAVKKVLELIERTAISTVTQLTTMLSTVLSTTIRETDWITTIVLAVILFIIGLAIG
uniref:Uncharacterized protein n=1 Tax=Ignisphaera aggregans TaxID=334771 RepID=A0A7C4BC03_9CREN